MNDEATSETPIVEGRTVVTAETVERPPSERPTHDNINGIADWMIGPARRITSGVAAIDECRRVVSQLNAGAAPPMKSLAKIRKRRNCLWAAV